MNEEHPRFPILLLGSQIATGGAQRILLDQAGWLHANGYPVTAAFFYDREGLESAWRAASPFPILNLNGWGPHNRLERSVRLAGALRRLHKILVSGRIAVVETFTHHANLLGIPAARLAGVPVRIASHHGRVADFSTAQLRLHTTLINSAWTTKLVMVSDWMARDAVSVEAIRPEKLRVIRNGITLPRVPQLTPAERQACRSRIGVEPDDFFVLAVGRLVEPKGHATLLEAVSPVLAVHPRTVFAIAGDGPLRPQLEAFARRIKILPAARFLGMRSDINQLLEAADLFVLPSLSEGLPVALLEAMGAGLPVIASRIPAINEVLQDGLNGIMVPPGDASALARELIRLIQNPPFRDTIARAGRERVETEYTLEQMGDSYRGLFEECLKQIRDAKR
jgi:glycosyltransferase involved in cell wall biosynthesis